MESIRVGKDGQITITIPPSSPSKSSTAEKDEATEDSISFPSVKLEDGPEEEGEPSEDQEKDLEESAAAADNQNDKDSDSTDPTASTSTGSDT